MSDAVVLSFLYMDGATDLRLGYIKSSDRAAQTPFYSESKTISTWSRHFHYSDGKKSQ